MNFKKGSGGSPPPSTSVLGLALSLRASQKEVRKFRSVRVAAPAIAASDHLGGDLLLAIASFTSPRPSQVHKAPHQEGPYARFDALQSFSR